MDRFSDRTPRTPVGRSINPVLRLAATVPLGERFVQPLLEPLLSRNGYRRSHSIETVCPRGRLVRSRAKRNKVRCLPAGGGTPIYAGFVLERTDASGLEQPVGIFPWWAC